MSFEDGPTKFRRLKRSFRGDNFSQSCTEESGGIESVHACGRCRPHEGRARDKDVTLQTPVLSPVPSPSHLPHTCKVETAPQHHQWMRRAIRLLIRHADLYLLLSCAFHVAFIFLLDHFWRTILSVRVSWKSGVPDMCGPPPCEPITASASSVEFPSDPFVGFTCISKKKLQIKK